MPVPQLANMLPVFGVVLPAGSSFQGGTANAKLSFAGPVEALVTNGTLGVSNTHLTGFDLGSKMSTIQKLAGSKAGRDTDIQTLAATVHMAPDGSTIEDIKFVALAMLGAKGDTGVPFTIEGTASNPVFRPDVKGMLARRVQSLEKNDMGKAAGKPLGGVSGR